MTLLAKKSMKQLLLKGKGMEAPEFGLILGSGLGERLKNRKSVVVTLKYQTGVVQQ